MNTESVRTLDLETLVLLSGSHPPNDGMCVMEAVAYVAGERHGDRPQCACPVISAFARSLNDRLDDGGRQALKPYIPRLVGSRSTPAVELKRGWLAADWLVHTAAPAWLRLAGLEDQALAIEAFQPIVNRASAIAIWPVLSAARSKAEAVRYEEYTALNKKSAAYAYAAAAYAAAYAAAAYAAAAYAAAYTAAAYTAAAGLRWASRSATSSMRTSAADAASAAAYTAASAAAAAAAAKSWDVIYKAVYEAAVMKLAPTKALVLTSAFELLDRMLAVTALAEEMEN